MIRRLCTEPTLRNVVLVTNVWGEVPMDVGEARERELTTNSFRPALDEGAQLVRHNNTVQSAHDIIRCIMRNPPLVLQILRDPLIGGRDMTDAGAAEVSGELNEQIRRHQAEVKALQEEMLQAFKETEKEIRRECEEEAHTLREWTRTELERVVSEHNEEKRRMEVVMWRIQEEARVERQRLLDCLDSRQCPRCQ